MSNLIGQSLGRYHILEQLGEGGMATVYKPYETRLETDVAVKVIRTENLAPSVLERALKRFEREAKALARLTHPNIVKVTDYGEHEGKPYLVMEYLPGGTLKQRLGKPMPWQEAVRLLIPIAEALDFAHSQNMIHRDVKPSNILLTQRGQPMLTDFGIAKILDLEETQDLTGTGMGIGTPEYMAPEQWTGKTSILSDQYALGVVFYEMLTGRKPYSADTPAAILLKQATEALPRPKQYMPGLPDDVEKVLLKALARKPEDRYADMAAFADGLEHLLAGQPKAKQAAVAAKASLPVSKAGPEAQATVMQEETNATSLQQPTYDKVPQKLPAQLSAPIVPSQKMNWPLLIWWILASIGGSIGGWAIVAAILSIGNKLGVWQIQMSFTNNIASETYASHSMGSMATLGVYVGGAAAIIGVVIGAGQWLVLRRHIHKAGWWVVVTMIGWAVSWALCLPILSIPALSFFAFLVGGVVGIITGVGQWLVLRRQLRMAGLWVLAAAIGSAMDLGLCDFFGAIATGFTLIWLLRNHSPDKEIMPISIGQTSTRSVITDKSGLAIAALIVGITAFVLNCLGSILLIPIGIIPAIPGVILGIIGIKSSKRGLSIAGIAISALTLVISLIWIVVLIYLYYLATRTPAV